MSHANDMASVGQTSYKCSFWYNGEDRNDDCKLLAEVKTGSREDKQYPHSCEKAVMEN